MINYYILQMLLLKLIQVWHSFEISLKSVILMTFLIPTHHHF